MSGLPEHILNLSVMSDTALAAMMNAINPSPEDFEREADREAFCVISLEVAQRWWAAQEWEKAQEAGQMAQLVEANNKLAAVELLEARWRRDPSAFFQGMASDLRRALRIKTVQNQLTEEHKDHIWKDNSGYYWVWVEKGRKGQTGWCCVGPMPDGNPDDSYVRVLHSSGQSASGPYEQLEDPAEPATPDET